MRKEVKEQILVSGGPPQKEIHLHLKGKFHECELKQDYVQAFHFLTQLSEVDDKEIQYKLGQYLCMGLGDTSNPTLGIQYYEKAARNNHRLAQMRLGNILIAGEHILKNEERGLALLELSTLELDPEPLCSLAEYFLQNPEFYDGSNSGLDIAYSLFQQANQDNFPLAAKKMQEMEKNGYMGMFFAENFYMSYISGKRKTAEIEKLAWPKLKSHEQKKHGKRKKIDSDPESLSSSSADLSGKTRKITGGIASKYLRETSIHLPKVIDEKKHEVSEHPKLELVSLRDLQGQVKTTLLEQKTYTYILNTGPSCQSKLSFISNRKELSPHDKVIFIFLGRGENAKVPIPSENIRMVLIIPDDQYQQIKDFSNGFDLLIINSLNSASHGEYKKLGLLTCRRIAGLLLARHMELHECIFMDDNIETIIFKNHNNLQPLSFLDLFKIPIPSQRTFTSIPTDFYTEISDNSLGCKVFITQMSMFLKLPIEKVFLFFLPAECADWVSEDYYMQIMAEKIQSPGYGVIPKREIVLTRMKSHTNQAAKTVKKAEVYLEKDPCYFLTLKYLEKFEQEYIKNTLSEMKRLINKSIREAQSQFSKAQTEGLISLHASLNKLRPHKRELFPVPKNVDSKLIFQLFKNNISQYTPALEKILRKHQLRALQELKVATLTQGVLSLATGGGKTLILVVVAQLIYDLGNIGKPIMIVTPNQDLLNQLYADFPRYLFELNKILPKVVSLDHVIKISSQASDINKTLFYINNSLRNKNIILLFCAASFIKLIEKDKQNILDRSILLIDESQELSTHNMREIYKNNSKYHAMLYELSATPRHKESKIIFEYSREEAVKDGVIAPLVIDKISMPYSEKNAKALIYYLPALLATFIHPSGLFLRQLKGIIYFPMGTKLEGKIHTMLTENHIFSFIIRSDNDQAKEDLEKFKAHQGPAVALTVKKLGVGFDDSALDYIIIIQSAQNPSRVLQMAGRVLRHPQYIKIGYVLAFEDINFPRPVNQTSDDDPSSKVLINENYRKKRISQLQQLQKRLLIDSENLSEIVQASENKMNFFQQAELLRTFEEDDKISSTISPNRFLFNPLLSVDKRPTYKLGPYKEEERIIEELRNLIEGLKRLQEPRQQQLMPTSPFSKEFCIAKIQCLQDQLKKLNAHPLPDIYKLNF